jgi:hypothetical protein
MTASTGKLQIYDINDKRAPQLMKEAIQWLTKSLPKQLSKDDTDLLNIRDEILADLNQTLYLFTFT